MKQIHKKKKGPEKRILKDGKEEEAICWVKKKKRKEKKRNNLAFLYSTLSSRINCLFQSSSGLVGSVHLALAQ